MDPAPPVPDSGPAKVLVYDGDCSLCCAASRRIVASARLPEAARASHLSFEGETAARLEAAGIRNEMAVISPATGEIRSGLPAILWFLRGTRWGWLASILDVGVLRPPMTFVYRMIAYNRRVIAPVPPRAFACACDPDPSPFFNAVFTSVVAAIAVVGAGFGEFYAQHAGPAPLAAFDPGMVLPWILLAALIAAAAFGPTGRRVAAHLAWVGAAAGILSVLVSPWAVHVIGPHLGRDISRVSRVGPPPALDAYRLPAWLLLAPAAGLVMGGLSLRRRWHLIRRLWDRTGP